VSTNAAEEQEIEIIEEDDKEQQEELKVEEEAPASEEQSASEEERSEPDKEEELEQYSKSVQTRINKLTHRYREEEAQKKAAVDFAAEVKKQNEELKIV